MNRAGRSLEDIALLLAASINEVHPYADANGRTSRLIYTLLTKGLSEETKDEIKKVLGEYGSEVVDINPVQITATLDDILENEIGLDDLNKNPHRIANILYPGSLSEIQFRREVPSELVENFSRALRYDSKYMDFAMFLHISENPEVRRYIKAFPTRSAVMLEQLAPDLTEDDLRKIMESYWELKKRYAELLIDSIAHPEKSKYVLRRSGQEESIPLLDYFKARIKQRQEEAPS